MDGQTFLRPRDVAPLLGVTTSRAYQLLRSGEIPSTRVGRAIVIPRGAWDRWLAEQSTRALAATRPPDDAQSASGHTMAGR